MGLSSSSPILANAFSGLGPEVGACDHSTLVPASKKPEHCANINLCRRYLFSCPSALIIISTSPVCAKKEIRSGVGRKNLHDVNDLGDVWNGQCARRPNSRAVKGPRLLDEKPWVAQGMIRMVMAARSSSHMLAQVSYIGQSNAPWSLPRCSCHSDEMSRR